MRLGSIFTPGPMVEAMTIERMYLPLAADEAVQARGQAGERRGDHPHEAPDEHLARRQPGDVADLLDGQRLAVEQAALERQGAGRAAEIGERLGGRRGVAANERDAGRPLEEHLELGRPGLVGRALGQRVLDHAEGGVRVAQSRPQLGGLRHGDAAVVDGVHRLRLGDLAGHLVDDGGLLVSVHPGPFLARPYRAHRALPGVFGREESRAS